MKHIPLRMCIACRSMKPQCELIRIVKNGGEPKLDINKKMFGRGAYLCRSAECIQRAEKRNLLARHFKCSVSREIYSSAEETV